MSNCRSPWRIILPAPVPGLVIRYNYNCGAASTWRAQGGAAQGEEISAKGDGLGGSALFEALQPVKEAGDLSARPARALVPELQQRVTVESDPRGDQRRALSNDVVRQAVRHHPWRVGDRHRAARLRFPCPAIEVLHARPVPAHACRYEDRPGDPGILLREVRHLDQVLVRQLVG